MPPKLPKPQHNISYKFSKIPFPSKVNSSGGQMLLGILIAVAVLSILAHALFTLTASSFDLVNFNKARITARHLAQEKLEGIRNLDYEDVGTIAGIPAGILDQEETVTRNSLVYTINTSVVYIDDPFDNFAPADLDPADYKRARVEVSWGGLAASKKNPIILITDITPHLSWSTTGGTLSILVVDSSGDPVSDAAVQIQAPSLVSPVDLTQNTNTDGEVVLPGAEPCVECYEITVTKSGYNTDRTYSSAEVTNPSKPHATILESEVTSISFSIDLTGTINISSRNDRDNSFTPLGDTVFRLRGNKIIGTDALGQPIYKYDEDLTTDGGGNYSATDLEWDTYRILIPDPPTRDITGSIPLQPVSILPDSTSDFEFASTPYSDHSLLVIVKDPSQNLIASSSARLYDTISYDETKITGISDDPDFGQVHFPSLVEQTYLIQATASGYLDYDGLFDVSGYTIGEVVLTPE